MSWRYAFTKQVADEEDIWTIREVYTNDTHGTIYGHTDPIAPQASTPEELARVLIRMTATFNGRYFDADTNEWIEEDENA